jgi:hypothetical protein
MGEREPGDPHEGRENRQGDADLEVFEEAHPGFYLFFSSLTRFLCASVVPLPIRGEASPTGLSGSLAFRSLGRVNIAH